MFKILAVLAVSIATVQGAGHVQGLADSFKSTCSAAVSGTDAALCNSVINSVTVVDSFGGKTPEEINALIAQETTALDTAKDTAAAAAADDGCDCPASGSGSSGSGSSRRRRAQHTGGSASAPASGDDCDCDRRQRRAGHAALVAACEAFADDIVESGTPAGRSRRAAHTAGFCGAQTAEVNALADALCACAGHSTLPAAGPPPPTPTSSAASVAATVASVVAAAAAAFAL